MKSLSEALMLILLIMTSLVLADREEPDSSFDTEYKDTDVCLSEEQYNNISSINTLNITDGIKIQFFDIKDDLKKVADDLNITNTLIYEYLEKILENQNETNVTLDGLATQIDVNNLNDSMINIMMNLTTGPEEIFNMLNETANNVLERFKEHLDLYNISITEELSIIRNQTLENFNTVNETLNTLALTSATDEIIAAISNLTAKHDILLDFLNEIPSQENDLSSTMTEHEDVMQGVLNSTKTELLNCCNKTSMDVLERLQELSDEIQPKFEGLADKSDVEILNDMLVQLTNKSSIDQLQGTEEDVSTSVTLHNYTQLLDEKFTTLIEQLQDNLTELSESTKTHITNVTCELRQGQEDDLANKLVDLENKFQNHTDQMLEKIESLSKCDDIKNLTEQIENLTKDEEICLPKDASNSSNFDVQSIVDELKQHLTQLVCKPDIVNITNLIKSLATKESIETLSEKLDSQPTEETMENTTSNSNLQSTEETIKNTTSNPNSQSTDKTMEKTTSNTNSQSTDKTTKNPTSIANSQSTEETMENTTSSTNSQSTDKTTKNPTSIANSQSTEETMENTTSSTNSQSTDKTTNNPTLIDNSQSTEETMENAISNSNSQSTEETTKNPTSNSNSQSTEETMKNPTLNSDIKQDLLELKEQINSLKKTIENKLSMDSLQEALAKMEERLQRNFKILQSERESHSSDNSKIPEIEKTIPEGESMVLTTPAATTMQPVECNQPFSNHGEGCYLIVQANPKSQTHANALCRRYGGILASPTRLGDLQDYLQLHHSEIFWIGARYDTRKGWHWPNGRAVASSEWVQGSPKRAKSKRCVFLDARHNYKLNNMHCNEKYKFICSPKN